jgi:hypothetical protein
MAILQGGGGTWKKLQADPVGTVTKGMFVSFTQDVASANAAYGKQDILRLDIDGTEFSIGCPAALARVFRQNKVPPGTLLTITYKGKTAKGGKQFHEFRVETDEEGGGDTSFPPPPARDEAADLEAKLAAMKAKKKAA